MTHSRTTDDETPEGRIEHLTEQLSIVRKELDELTYAISHDLRAPLRSVFGFTQLLARKHSSRLDGQALDYLGRIGSGAARMEQMIEALLLLSRTGRMEVHREEVNAAAVVRSVMDELREAEPERAVELHVDDPLKLYADPRLVRLIFSNLLGNAWKFTGGVAEPRIQVVVQEMNGTVFCCVRDNGAGFAMNQADRLFRPFQRLHLDSEFPGIGMGLAIVKKIVDRHGGTVMAEGEEGRGAKFCFSLEDSGREAPDARENR